MLKSVIEKLIVCAAGAALLTLTACGGADDGTSQQAAPATAPAASAQEPSVPPTAPDDGTGTAGSDTVAMEPAGTPDIASTAGESPVTAEPAASSEPVDGGEIYNTICLVCHQAGMNAAPKFGNKILWGRVVKQGRETVYKHAIEGIRGMPARGGLATLTDEEVKAAVDYMVMAGGGWRESR